MKLIYTLLIIIKYTYRVVQHKESLLDVMRVPESMYILLYKTIKYFLLIYQ
jgi:hypothetical protein